MNLHPASLVKALAGKEKGRYYAVLSVIDENYVLLCDGRRRKTVSPKKKKIKHVENMSYSLNSIKDKLDSGNKISNSNIRKSIREALIALGISEEE